MSDLTGTGDSFATNYMVDNVLVGSDGRCDKMAQLYANGHDLKDPMLSPVYGDMKGFSTDDSHDRHTRTSCSATPCGSTASCVRPASSRSCTFTRGNHTRSTVRDANAPETKEGVRGDREVFRSVSR
jgi:hypothetical protein